MIIQENPLEVSSNKAIICLDITELTTIMSIIKLYTMGLRL